MTAHCGDPAATLREFSTAVNMTPAALEKWLATGESRAVGITPGEGTESVGHLSGRRIVELLNKAPGDLVETDLAHMRKVVGYVHRHLAQRPSGDVRNTVWRWSLMNWGHDPLEP
jgi:hypothetical protein